MRSKVIGNTKGLAAVEHRQLDKIIGRKTDKHEVISHALAREICLLGEKLKRRIALVIDRNGVIQYLVVGTKQVFYLPDFGRFGSQPGRLRGLRVVYTDLSTTNVQISTDVFGDLEKLRLDLVAAIKLQSDQITMHYAHLSPDQTGYQVLEEKTYLHDLDLDFSDWILDIENELASSVPKLTGNYSNFAILVGVYDVPAKVADERIAELKLLADSAGVKIADIIIQKRKPDPRLLVGRGKVEEIVLRALRLGADLLIFDGELSPSQWRSITNDTELKVIDRSMLILDIFAKRAKSNLGKTQVELAQLKYNLPRLTETDSGLSRLSGGIGGRGPGETKLEVSRRRFRDRIHQLENEINDLQKHRQASKQRQKDNSVLQVALVGYTNAGKSTLFNALTKSEVLVANKLFATLDTTQRKLYMPETVQPVLLSDTVGFIRDLPRELVNAFKATLDELQDADLFLHVLDASDLEIDNQKLSVERILKDLGLENIPTLLVVNKIDRVSDLDFSRFEGDVCQTSSTKNIGLVELKNKIAEILSRKKTTQTTPNSETQDW